VTGLKCLKRLQSYEKAMGWCTAHCKMLLLLVKTIVKESCKFELVHLQKKKKKKETFGDFLIRHFTMYFDATRSFVGHENIQKMNCVLS